MDYLKTLGGTPLSAQLLVASKRVLVKGTGGELFSLQADNLHSLHTQGSTRRAHTPHKPKPVRVVWSFVEPPCALPRRRKRTMLAD
jgi:hypothetical protein